LGNNNTNSGKISKERLKQIIKEEVERFAFENEEDQDEEEVLSDDDMKEIEEAIKMPSWLSRGVSSRFNRKVPQQKARLGGLSPQGEPEEIPGRWKDQTTAFKQGFEWDDEPTPREEKPSKWSRMVDKWADKDQDTSGVFGDKKAFSPEDRTVKNLKMNDQNADFLDKKPEPMAGEDIVDRFSNSQGAPKLSSKEKSAIINMTKRALTFSMKRTDLRNPEMYEKVVNNVVSAVTNAILSVEKNSNYKPSGQDIERIPLDESKKINIAKVNIQNYVLGVLTEMLSK
jgi:hypothetical protein